MRRLLLIIPFITSLGCLPADKSVISQATDTHKTLEPAVIEDRELNDYMEQIGRRIVDAAQALDQQGFGPKAHKSDEDTSWMYNNEEFHLVSSNTLNAFTTGGKHLYIYTELLKYCKTEDELAAVMSHEYAHVYCRHVAQGMQRQYAILGLAGAAAVGGAAAGYSNGGTDDALQYGALTGGAALVAGQFVGMGFTRDNEDEADKIGFQFYCHAGWDPQQFPGFFQTLIDKGMDKTPEALSDHPKLANRVAATKKRIAALPAEASSWRKPEIADQAKFNELKARAERISSQMPNDGSLQQARMLFAAFPSCVSPAEQPDQVAAQNKVKKAMKKAKKSQSEG